ncbi:putative transcriptional regulator, LuxR family protein [Bacteroidia bacterium]|nr:putative transcriptional regulator, LuxR family protein [Bacteroidia bacterium]
MIVDDHKVVADGLERMINDSETVRVTGKAYSVAECRELLKTGQPDVLLLDVSLPDGNGIELCPEIKRKYPQVKILMLTSYGELATITCALDAGADCYVLKNSMPEEVLEGIRVVAEGGRFLCDRVTSLMQNYEKYSLEFTRRELEVLRYIKEGLTSAEIADKFFLGFETIRGYRKDLYVKLNAHSTRELISKAVELGLV